MSVSARCEPELGDYSPLSHGWTRLLRLRPHKDNQARVECQLFDYPLQEVGDESHLYEALSYVWGDPGHRCSILINDREMSITENLHAALVHLRNHFLDRVLWVDAVCINQQDLSEKGEQVQLMAEIYSKASRVIVWLGDAQENSDQALEEIRLAAAGALTDPTISESTEQAVLALLRRPWFERIWVLQEVAAARDIIVRCGYTEIDGHAFSAGLMSKVFERLERNLLAIQNPVHTVLDLMRHAGFRSRRVPRSTGRFSLCIRPLAELIQMFHTRKATMRHDKIVALLGMSTDDPAVAGLSVHYKMPWHTLLEKLVLYLLGAEVLVKTWPEREMVLIKAKGYVLGRIASVTTTDLRNKQDIVLTLAYRLSVCRPQSKWRLPGSAKSVQAGDLLCVLCGSSTPIIIRPCRDFFSIILNLASISPKMPKAPPPVREFILLWDWQTYQGNLPKPHEILIGDMLPEIPKEMLGGHYNILIRLWSAACILEDADAFKEARVRLKEAVNGHEKIYEAPSIIYKEKLALIDYKEFWQEVIRRKPRSRCVPLGFRDEVWERWIVKLLVPQGGRNSQGTGFFLNVPTGTKNIILTAGHILTNDRGEVAEDVMVIEKSNTWSSAQRGCSIFVSDANPDIGGNYGAIVIPKPESYKSRAPGSGPSSGFGFALGLSYANLVNRDFTITSCRDTYDREEYRRPITIMMRCLISQETQLMCNMPLEQITGGSPVFMSHEGHETAVAIYIGNGVSTRLSERALEEIMYWAGLSHHNKSLRLCSPRAPLGGVYLCFPPHDNNGRLETGDETSEAAFDIFPAYAPSSTDVDRGHNSIRYVFRFRSSSAQPCPKTRWVFWDIIGSGVTLTHTLHEFCFVSIARMHERVRLILTQRDVYSYLYIEVPKNNRPRLSFVELNHLPTYNEDKFGVFCLVPQDKENGKEVESIEKNPLVTRRSMHQTPSQK